MYLYPTLVATPLVACAVLQLCCAAGVVVTASHNPAPYNGYKVYHCNGCQIIPPHDAGIAAQIEAHTDLWPLMDAAAVWAHPLLRDPTPLVLPTYLSYLQVCTSTWQPDMSGALACVRGEPCTAQNALCAVLSSSTVLKNCPHLLIEQRCGCKALIVCHGRIRQPSHAWSGAYAPQRLLTREAKCRTIYASGAP